MKKWLFLYLICCTFLYSEQNQKWKNPYKSYNNFKISKVVLKNYKVSNYEAGFIDSPNKTVVSFNLFQDNKPFFIGQQKINFSLKCGVDEINIGDDHPQIINGRYRYEFRLPQRKRSDDRCNINLRASNFYYEDSNFFFYKDRKLNIVFLLDNSGSMRMNDATNKRITSVYKILENNRRRFNKISVIGFSDDINIIWDWKKVKNISLFKKALDQPFRFGGTNISRSFIGVASYIKKKNTSNEDVKIVFLTDGYPSTIYRNEHQLFKQMNIPIYSIGLGRKNNYNETLLKNIALDTGGKYFNADNFNIEDVYKNVINTMGISTKKTLVYHQDIFSDNEMVSFYFLKPVKNISIYINGVKKNNFFEKRDKEQLMVGLLPLEVGKYKAMITYNDGIKNYRERANFKVKRTESNRFVLKGDLMHNRVSPNSIYRMPLTIENITNEKNSYELNFFYKNPNKGAKMVTLEKNNYNLKGGERKSFSLEIDTRIFEKIENSYYLFIKDGMRYYVYDVNLDKVDQYLKVNRFANNSFLTKSDNLEKYMLLLWGLTILSGLYWLNRKWRKGIFHV